MLIMVRIIPHQFLRHDTLKIKNKSWVFIIIILLVIKSLHSTGHTITKFFSVFRIFFQISTRGKRFFSFYRYRCGSSEQVTRTRRRANLRNYLLHRNQVSECLFGTGRRSNQRRRHVAR